MPNENQRRLVADGDRLYATLGFQAPLSILNAATGEVLATVEGTSPAKEILASDGVVVVHCSDPSAGAAKRRGKGDGKTSRLIAVQGDTGAVLWSKETKAINPLQLAIDGGRVVYQAGSTLTALSLTDGRPQWSVDGVPGKARTLIGHDGVVLPYAQNTLEARDGASGDLLWRQEVPPSTRRRKRGLVRRQRRGLARHGVRRREREAGRQERRGNGHRLRSANGRGEEADRRAGTCAARNTITAAIATRRPSGI